MSSTSGDNDINIVQLLDDCRVADETVREDESDSNDAIMCLLFRNARMSAAYYRISDKILYFVEELIDFQPHYSHASAILREVRPVHVLTLGSPCDHFVKTLVDMMAEQKGEASSNTSSSPSHRSYDLKTMPDNLSLLPSKEYSHVLCEHRVKALHTRSEAEGLSYEEHQLHLQSQSINFQMKLTVHALGALVKFVEKHWHQLKGDVAGDLVFYHLKRSTISDHVLIDEMTFNALQVFRTLNHDASFKRGSNSTSREGASLFKLLSQHCRSSLGYVKLRNLMATPTNNVRELKKRLDFIDFARCPSRAAFIDALSEVIKNVSNLNSIFTKIQHSRGTKRDWKLLYTTIYNVLFLNEFCATHKDEVEIFSELNEKVSASLYGLERSIYSTLDFKLQASKNNRPAIKAGLDVDLDEKKMIKEDIFKRVTVAANIVVDQLPAFLKECVVCFIPDMGHVVAVKKWDQNCDPRSMHEFGFQYMFELNDNYHYKNALCQELDKQLGNVITDILEHEHRIIERLADFVLRFNNHIREPLDVIALIDCLISMAKVSFEKGYVRPRFNDSNVIEIVGGRHPLLELTDSNYVKNDYASGGASKPMKIITGPNSSGKTIFLKQTALLVYLAHIGCNLPASDANVAILHSIHSRMHATESALLNLSAFAIDLTQMARALQNAKRNSLVMMDEFGRGTTGTEGLALLLGALRKFLGQGSYCPHVVVSTHLECPEELLDGSMIDYLTLEHTRDPNDDRIVFLYRVIEGKAPSYGLQIASSVQLDADIVRRAQDFLHDFESICPQPSGIPEGYDEESCSTSDLFLRTIKIPDLSD
ncbi:PREDICTED: mutS protein homolog 5-like [Nicrophorus vespilloides]|uniref:MutS protein homolog 5-like n=1 Tax=Nicrophorus vespilloides TaxID=110193 RepID=A0ABM1ND19_NICVS|nr:PREDICTED: mutS protein homolog 5-like [Nicrophorus vespilloides]